MGERWHEDADGEECSWEQTINCSGTKKYPDSPEKTFQKSWQAIDLSIKLA